MAEEDSSNLTNGSEKAELPWPEVIDLHIYLPEGGPMLRLPGVNSNETLNAIRQAMAEFQESAFLTSFHLELRHIIDVDGQIVEKNVPDYGDFSELNSFLDRRTKVCVLDALDDAYDMRKIKFHIKRIKDVMERTHLMSAADKSQPPTKANNNDNEVNDAAVVKSVEERNNGVEEAKPVSPEIETGNGVAKATKPSAKPSLPKFHEIWSEEPKISRYFEQALCIAASKEAGKIGNKDTLPLQNVIKGIHFSGWNPPPYNRKLQGDIMYLEVVLANEGTIYITATAR